MTKINTNKISDCTDILSKESTKIDGKKGSFVAGTFNSSVSNTLTSSLLKVEDSYSTISNELNDLYTYLKNYSSDSEGKENIMSDENGTILDNAVYAAVNNYRDVLKKFSMGLSTFTSQMNMNIDNSDHNRETATSYFQSNKFIDKMISLSCFALNVYGYYDNNKGKFIYGYTDIYNKPDSKCKTYDKVNLSEASPIYNIYAIVNNGYQRIFKRLFSNNPLMLDDLKNYKAETYNNELSATGNGYQLFAPNYDSSGEVEYKVVFLAGGNGAVSSLFGKVFKEVTCYMESEGLVAPTIYVDLSKSSRSLDSVTQILNEIEETYPVSKNREDHAFIGFSLGGFQAFKMLAPGDNKSLASEFGTIIAVSPGETSTSSPFTITNDTVNNLNEVDSDGKTILDKYPTNLILSIGQLEDIASFRGNNSVNFFNQIVDECNDLAYGKNAFAINFEGQHNELGTYLTMEKILPIIWPNEI